MNGESGPNGRLLTNIAILLHLIPQSFAAYHLLAPGVRGRPPKGIAVTYWARRIKAPAVIPTDYCVSSREIAPC